MEHVQVPTLCGAREGFRVQLPSKPLQKFHIVARESPGGIGRGALGFIELHPDFAAASERRPDGTSTLVG